MKIGFVLECQVAGPEVQMCDFIARQVCPFAVPSFSTLSNKRVLMEQCGEEANKLLGAGCECVFVVWDLRPAWPDDAADLDCVREAEIVKATLHAARVPLQKAILLCVTREIEVWLLADPDAIREFCRHGPHEAERVPSQGRVERIDWPKDRIEQLCKERRRRFTPSLDALSILKLARRGRLRSVQSYARLEDKIAALMQGRAAPAAPLEPRGRARVPTLRRRR